MHRALFTPWSARSKRREQVMVKRAEREDVFTRRPLRRSVRKRPDPVPGRRKRGTRVRPESNGGGFQIIDVMDRLMAEHFGIG
jgi:hypothetical protein